MRFIALLSAAALASACMYTHAETNIGVQHELAIAHVDVAHLGSQSEPHDVRLTIVGKPGTHFVGNARITRDRDMLVIATAYDGHPPLRVPVTDIRSIDLVTETHRRAESSHRSVNPAPLIVGVLVSAVAFGLGVGIALSRLDMNFGEWTLGDSP